MSKVLIVYWSGTGNTQSMAELILDGANQAGADATLKSVSDAAPEEIANYDVVALGCPSMGAEELDDEEMEPFVASIEGMVKDKKIALFGSYGWGDGEWMRNWEQRMRDNGAILVGDEGLIVNEMPEGDDEQRCLDFGKALA